MKVADFGLARSLDIKEPE
jgi:mitogen-activated protein kinase 15